MHKKIEVTRTLYRGTSCIRKQTRDDHEAIILPILYELGVPCPKLIAREQTEEGSFIFIEDLGHEHLETNPGYFDQAIELLAQIRMLPNHPKFEAVQPAHSFPAAITTQQLYSRLTSWEYKCLASLFPWEYSQLKVIQDAFSWITAQGSFNEPLCFSHGDYHPLNLMLRGESIVPIDWERAGFHSIYLDVYSLLFLGYLDQKACLLPQTRKRLIEHFVQQSTLPITMQGFTTFHLLHRLVELKHVSEDLASGYRDKAGLILQADMIWHDIKQVIDKERMN